MTSNPRPALTRSSGRHLPRLAVGLLALCGAAHLATAQTVPTGFSPTAVVTGLTGPTCMAVTPDGSVYIAQQTGALRFWSRSTNTLTTVTTFTVDSTGERGLIGVALDPSFTTSRFIYVHYTVPASAGGPFNRISRITVDAAGTALIAGSERVLVTLEPLGATNHNGGAMHFGPDGKLYVGVGENAVSTNAQSLTTRKGKILRYNSDGTIPADNPTTFAGISGSPTGDNRAIWAVGLRNPFTFAFQPGTGRMFINDVGNGTWEEVNDGLVGRNYGWPNTEGRFTQSSFPNFTSPLVSYQHTGGTANYPPDIGTFTGNVIAGGAFYNPSSPNFPIAYQGTYFFADSGAGFVRSFNPATNTGAAFATGASGVVDLDVAPDGTLLILTRNSGLRRVTYTLTSGVCCSTSGACSLSNGIACTGTFTWGVTSCTPLPCTVPTGACCTGTSCSSQTASACAALAGQYAGDNSACNAPGNNTTPCCRADVDQSGTRDVADIFAFLSAWFAQQPAADFDTNSTIEVADIFAYLSAYFAGC